MDNADKEKIEQIISDRKKAHQYFAGNSKTYVAFTKMAGEAFSAGELDRKTKELMAVSVSVVIHCESCMEWHIGEALRNGATEKQIVEAIDVATEMGGGPATVAARFAMKVIKYYGEQENRR